MNQRNSNIAPAFLLMVGFIAAGFLVGSALRDMQRGARSVSVRGLVEQEIPADRALWALKSKIAGNDLVAAQRELEQSTQRIAAFLKERGFAEADFEIRNLRVFDRRAQEYGNDANSANAMRYLVEGTVFVRTGEVDKVVKASQQVGELIKSGVTLIEDNTCSPGPTYLFTKLNEIKPTMLAQATANARKSAEQFAADSGSRVGAIKNAYQGVFSITARDDLGETSETGGGCTPSDPFKKIRVVTTIDYYLEG